mmetsp:Transcript_8724/g.23553  ORF Transcript_8724/g.23553 Transcript_8724/m.23553 type:complete len:263 (-) Transcript_8724:394-1182(-)
MLMTRKTQLSTKSTTGKWMRTRPLIRRWKTPLTKVKQSSKRKRTKTFNMSRNTTTQSTPLRRKNKKTSQQLRKLTTNMKRRSSKMWRTSTKSKRCSTTTMGGNTTTTPRTFTKTTTMRTRTGTTIGMERGVNTDARICSRRIWEQRRMTQGREPAKTIGRPSRSTAAAKHAMRTCWITLRRRTSRRCSFTRRKRSCTSPPQPGPLFSRCWRISVIVWPQPPRMRSNCFPATAPVAAGCWPREHIAKVHAQPRVKCDPKDATE